MKTLNKLPLTSVVSLLLTVGVTDNATSLEGSATEGHGNNRDD